MRGVKRELARLIERTLIGQCRIITSANGPIADWYSTEYGIDRPLVFLNIPPTVDAEEMNQPGSDGLRRQLGVPEGALLFAHTGNLRNGRHIPEILAAFEDARCNHHVVFFGDGPLRPLVTEASLRCPRIHDGGLVPHSRIVSLLQDADVALALIATESPSYRLSSPNKVMEAWVAGIPVLATDLPFVRSRLVGDEANVWLVQDASEGIAHALFCLRIDDVRAHQARERPSLPETGLDQIVRAYGSVLHSPMRTDSSGSTEPEPQDRTRNVSTHASLD